jgi:hypothetical protein
LCAAAKKVAASLRDADASVRPGEPSSEETHPPNTDRAADFLTTQPEWDPFRFVDLVAAAARGKSSSEQLCRQIQRREWELLFDYCFRETTGTN